MIELSEAIPLSEAPNHYPKRRERGRMQKVSYTTVHRWAINGLAGVKLETINLPSGRYTSPDAIEAFCRAVHRAKTGNAAVSFSKNRSLRIDTDVDDDPPRIAISKAERRRVNRILGRHGLAMPEQQTG